MNTAFISELLSSQGEKGNALNSLVFYILSIAVCNSVWTIVIVILRLARKSQSTGCLTRVPSGGYP